MAKNFFYMIGIFIMIAIAGFFLLKGEISKNTEVFGAGIQGSVQKVTLSIKNYNYYPNTVKVKVGQPVRIYLDESVVGCYRSFTIKDFGVSEYLKTPEDYLEFMPTKSGIHAFSCSMGMGRGTLIVE